MYAIYLRKSREDKELEALGEGETLARHRMQLMKLARKDGYKITKVYEEIVSGSSIEDRPEMQKLLIDVQMKKYKGVLVMDTSRLARGNATDQGRITEAFSRSNTNIITPNKVYELSSKMDKKFLTYNLFFASQEYEFIIERLQVGIDASFNEGNYIAPKAPYGYDVLRKNKRERTIIKNEKSKYVEMIFNWYAYDRMTAGEIARKLTVMSVPSPSGRKVWSRETIKDIVKNPIYIGNMRWDNRKKERVYFEDGTFKDVVKRSKPQDVKINKGKHEGIVSEDTFMVAQSIAYNNPSLKHGDKLKNPLARLMFCKKCGKAMRLASNKGKPRFVHAESMDCKVKSTKYEDVMYALVDELKICVEDFEIKKTQDDASLMLEQYEETIKEMKSSLVKLEIKLDRLFESFEEGLYTKEEFAKRKLVYNDKIQQLEQAIILEEENAPVEMNYEEEIIKFSQLIETLKSDVFEAKQKNDLLRTIIEKIEYECEDLGRNKGGIVRLSVYLRS